MKKIFKFFLLIPVFLITSIFAFGCGCNDDSLKSIELSLSGYQIIDGYYSVEKTDKSITIDTKLNPSKYSVDSLEWASSATDVVTVYKNTFKTKGAGKAIITATYKDGDGNEVKGSIKIWVTQDASVMGFAQSNYTTIYSGVDVRDNYKILQDTGNQEYNYKFISLTKGEVLGDEEEVIDAGDYQILCSKANNPDIYCFTTLTINKYSLNLSTSGNFEITYGDKFGENYSNDLPDMLFYSDSLNGRLKDLNIGEQVVGIGNDEDSEIGRYVYTIPASTILSVGNYTTSLYFEFNNDFANNYQISTSMGLLQVKAKEVVLKVNDISTIYGDKIPSYFNLYSFEDYTKGGNLLDGLESLSVSFNSNISFKTSYYHENGEVANLNSVNCLPVIIKTNEEDNIVYGEYVLKYEQVLSNKNLVVKEVLDGKLKVKPREVTVLPNEYQSKVYLSEDPTINYVTTINSFVGGENIKQFLFIDYEQDFATGNFKAEVGEYYYKIIDKNSEGELLNPNYIISLDNRAIYKEAEDNTNKVKFKVIAGTIEFEIESLEEKYRKPTDIIDDENIHSLSYYIGSDCDYITIIKSIKLNGINVDLTVLEELVKTASWDGTIPINYNVSGEAKVVKTENNSNDSTEDPETVSEENNNTTNENFEFGISFNINLNDFSNGKYYRSYVATLGSLSYKNENADNFSVTLKSGATLNLKMIYLTVTPNMTEGLVNKVYGSETPDFSEDYTVKGEIEENVSLENIFSNGKEILALSGDGVNVGKYKIVLNEDLTYKDGMEYYDISLDSSKDYYFTVSPFKLLITPNNLNKVYGDDDPELAYEMSSYEGVNLPDEMKSGNNSLQEGSLVREKGANGENVGKYKINIGTLSFGRNYEVVLSEEVKYFEILKREVSITPISYTSTYGDAINIGYTFFIAGEYNSEIIEYPTFSGSFRLGYRSLDTTGETLDTINVEYAQTVAGYYSVLTKEDGSVSSYKIGIGSFTCNSNYYIKFVNASASYTIKPKEIILDIETSNIDNKDNLNSTISSSNESLKYSIIDASTGNFISNISADFSLSLNLDNDYYVNATSIENVEIYSTVSDTQTNIAHCYSISLGNKVVYNIDVTIINLEIAFNNGDGYLNAVEKVYDKIPFNSFELVCKEEGYTISPSSKFSIVYSKGGETDSQVTNVGYYVAKLDLSDEDSKLIIVKNDHTCTESCEEECADLAKRKEIEFSTIDGTIVDNHLSIITSNGYLNIKKANISYNKDKIRFEEALIYGSNELSNLAILDEEDKSIFWGVDNESIFLKSTNINGKELNFSYSQGSYSLSTLNANTSYPINVNIQETSGNYNSLNINVPLEVLPRAIHVNPTISCSDPNLVDRTTIFDGTSKVYSVLAGTEDNPNKQSSEITVSYSYEKFITSYDKSDTAAIECYLKNGDDTPNFEEKRTIDFATLSNETYLEYIGDYIKLPVGNETWLIPIVRMSSSPSNAGVYICKVTYRSTDNYVMKFPISNGSDGNTYEETDENAVDSLSEYIMYEIKKSNAISVTDWKEEFYYTTEFDLSNSENVPFEYTMSPNFKNNVVYDLKTQVETSVLDVGEYSVALNVETDNYYYSQTFKFNVKPLVADFVFPQVRTYVYTGSSVESFLNSIRINQKDKDGNIINSFYYEKGVYDDVISISYLNADGNDFVPTEEYPAPYEVSGEGEFYTLKIKYAYKDETKQANFEGEGTFEYSIIKKSFTGSLSFENKTIAYSSDLTAKQIYDYIYNEMFSIKLSEGYSVGFKYLTYDITEQEDEWFEKFLDDTRSDATQKKIIATVTFKNEEGVEEYQPKSVEAVLSFASRGVDQSKFIQTSSVQRYLYTGYQVFNTLDFKPEGFTNSKITLNPLADDFNITLNGVSSKRITLTENGVSKTYVLNKDSNTELTLRDNLDNIIFVIKYSFEKSTAGTDSWDVHTAIPRNPGRYKSTYSLSYGKYYAGTGIFESSKEYDISKVTLYLKINSDQDITSVYDGTNQFDKLVKQKLITTNASVSQTSIMLVTLTNGNVSYSSDNGVHLRYVLEKENSSGEYETVYNVINAGDYKVKISLLVDPEYELADFFNFVNYGSGDLPVSEIIADSSYYFSFNFTIEKKEVTIPCSVSGNNTIPESIEKGSSATITNIEVGVNNIEIIKENEDGTEETIVSKLDVGYDLSSLAAGKYYIKFTVDTENCYPLNEGEDKITFYVVEAEPGDE